MMTDTSSVTRLRNGFRRVRENWRRLKASKPGERFRDRYNRRHKRSGGKRNLNTALNVAIGVGFVLTGVVFMAIPGPGSLLVVIGLGLLGSEWLPLARALDWTEMRLRALLHHAWTKHGWFVRSLIILAALIVVAAFLLAAWMFYSRLM